MQQVVSDSDVIIILPKKDESCNKRMRARLGLDYFILHTGQHYTYNRNKVFFEQLEFLIDMASSPNNDGSFQP